MVMDQPLSKFFGPANVLESSDETLLELSYHNIGNGFNTDNKVVEQSCASIVHWPPDPISSNLPLASNENPEGDLDEDSDFSDIVLKYINQILMDEDMEEKTCMYQCSAALEAAEKPFYDLLGEKYPPSPNNGLIPYGDQNHEIPGDNHALNCSDCNSSTSDTNFVVPGRDCDLVWYKSSHIAPQSTSQSCYSLLNLNSIGDIIDGSVVSPASTLSVPETFYESESILQFKRGFEEANKFLPDGDIVVVDLESNGLLVKEQKEETKNVVGKIQKKPENLDSLDWSRTKKNCNHEDVNLEEGRSLKQLAAYTESTVSPEMFDMILLNCEESDSVLSKTIQNGKSNNVLVNGRSKASVGGKARGRKLGGKRDVVDLRTLLMLCAEAVAADDWRSATELLKQIRHHSSPMGDGMQRIAHYFANGLQARMAGSGTQIYTALMTRRTSAADVLKAYHLLLRAFPYRKLSNFFSNKTIMNVAKKQMRLHIIDFGILYGFQWPSFIQQLSSRPGGPPKLRITGIDFPQPGFRPAERVEETGCRLANYAKTFNVPFEFNAIAQKWETIQIEDLKLDNREVLVVNALYSLKYLFDIETVGVESPRNIVLHLIRKMNPDIFIQGIVNAAHGAPFFTTRFREALFHFSTMFDMLETNVPRESPERMLLESEIFGRLAMNVIACEGSERIARPETYKQWQIRNLRAGFRQLPLNQEIMNTAKDWLKSRYHKDFVIGEDGQWLLHCWKGRTNFALSSWRPAF